MAVWHPYVTDKAAYDPICSGSIDGTDSQPHDKAVIRAHFSKYSPNTLAFPERTFRLCAEIDSVPEATLFVGRLAFDTTSSQLRRALHRLLRQSKRGAESPSSSRRRHSRNPRRSRSPFADDVSVSSAPSETSCLWPLVRIVKNIITGEPLSYAFALFASSEDAKKVLNLWRRTSLLKSRTERRFEFSDRDRNRSFSNFHLVDAFGDLPCWEQIILEPSFSRGLTGWKPRRLGGGLGGRKESGQLRFGGISRPFRRPYSSFTTSENAGGCE